MTSFDFLYGAFKLEPVLAELIASAPVQRLKGVHQGGAIYLVRDEWNVTRYEHSLGTMLLVRRLGGSVEEQVAALLHDVSHTAFSHVTDHVFGHKEEDYHEKIFASVVEQSEIPALLAKHGLDGRAILSDMEQWPILEKAAPDLCADRLDYTLRDIHYYFGVPQEEVERFVSSLRFEQGVLCTDSLEQAEWFVKQYYDLVIGLFLHPLNIYSYDRLAKALQAALEHGVITRDDLLADDETVMRKMKASGHPRVLQHLAGLHTGVQVTEDETDYEIHKKLKPRLIDPLVWEKGSLRRASELSERVREMGAAAKARSERGAFVKVVKA